LSLSGDRALATFDTLKIDVARVLIDLLNNLVYYLSCK
jgi:hypothetical protein